MVVERWINNPKTTNLLGFITENRALRHSAAMLRVNLQQNCVLWHPKTAISINLYTKKTRVEWI